MTTLLNLTDTPSSYDDGKYLKSVVSGTEWATLSGIDHGGLVGLDDDDHTQYVLHTYGIGTYNFVAGNDAGAALQLGANGNILIGEQAGMSLTTQGYNVMIGLNAGATTTNGACNTFVGVLAGATNINGPDNTFVGYSAGRYSTGWYNTFIGREAGANNTSGTANTFIGHSAGPLGAGDTTSQDRVFIGRHAGAWITGSYKLAIDSSPGTEDTPLIYGDFDTDQLGINTFTLNETLNVGGAINLGTTATTNSGTIRYTGSDFEGYYDGRWHSFTATVVGTIDHGALVGLVDDDHLQYHNDARGDVRYSQSGHNHDDRYYTETEVDIQMFGKSDIGHSHIESDIADLDKYTQSEVDTISESLQTQINNTSFIYNGDVYFVDSTRSNKELGVAILEVGCGRNKVTVSNQYLRSYNGILMNDAGIILPYDTTLVGITLSTRDNEAWTAEIRKNGSIIVEDSLSVINDSKNYNFTKNTDFNAGDSVQVYLNGAGVSYPQVGVYFRRRK